MTLLMKDQIMKDQTMKDQMMPTVAILDAPLVIQFDPVIQMDGDHFFDLGDIWEPGF